MTAMVQTFQAAKTLDYGRGEEIATQGVVHMIHEGYVGLYDQSDGARKLLFIYKPGDIIPMFTGATEARNSTYVYIAMKKSLLQTLTKAEFDAAIRVPEIAQQLLEYTRTISELQFERIYNMQQTQVLTRLLERLLFFAHRLGYEHKGKIRIDVPLSHVDIATSIGATRETVNRYMRQLEEQGFIRVHRQYITIHSLERLQMLRDQKTVSNKGNWLLMGYVAAGTAFAQTLQQTPPL